MTNPELIARMRSVLTFKDLRLCPTAADRIETLEAKLAENEVRLRKAVEALDEAVYLLKPDEKDMMRQAGVYRIVTTLAEIKGESHE